MYIIYYIFFILFGRQRTYKNTKQDTSLFGT